MGDEAHGTVGHEHLWQGSFIGGSESHAAGPAPAPYFRREVTVGVGLRRARLHVTALGIIEAYLNGRVIGDEVLCPGWTSYDHRVLVSTHDVTGWLHEGVNVLGAIVGEGWAVGRIGWAGARALWSERPAAYLQLELDYPDRTEVVSTDESWRTAVGAVIADGIYDGETYDARREPSGWATAAFDDARWEQARPVAWDRSRLEPRRAPPIRRTQELEAVEVLATPGGRTVVDFGQIVSGWVFLRVEGQPGRTVTLRHCELMVGGEPDFESNRTAEATDRYTLRGGGPETWEPTFTFHGFRYVDVEGWPGELTKDALTAVVVHSDMARVGWFETSDEKLNRLHANTVWSFRDNAVGLPTDCPQRDERLGWTGDINAFGPTAAFLYDVSGFLGSWLDDLAAEQAERGRVPFVVPDALGRRPSWRDAVGPTALWGDVAVGLPWTLYMADGDTGALGRRYPSMKAFVASVVPMLDDASLWSKGFQFGDWLDPDAPRGQPTKGKTEPTLVATAYLCRTLAQLGAAAAALGHEDDERWCAQLRKTVRAGFRREWVTPSGRLSNESQTAYALALSFDLLDPDQEARAGERLADLVTAGGFHIGTGFAGTPWLLPALTRAGHLDIAYRVLFETTPPSFLYPVTMGATTIWERWDAVLEDGSLNSTGMTSLNHYALGSVGDWLHRTVGGIEAAEPGYRVTRVAPRPGGGLTWARTAHDTAHGRIEVEWRTEGTLLSLKVSLPEGVTALVELPGHAPPRIETVGAGTYDWEYLADPGPVSTRRSRS